MPHKTLLELFYTVALVFTLATKAEGVYGSTGRAFRCARTFRWLADVQIDFAERKHWGATHWCGTQKSNNKTVQQRSDLVA